MITLNKKEFESLFNLYYNSLCKYLLLFTDDYNMIEDTVQSVFTKLWADKEKISVEYIKTYLFVSSRNRILNSIRDQQRRRDLLHDYFVNELEKEQAHDIVDIEEFIALVNKAINELPPKTKELFCLNRYTKMTYKDIALQNNISIKTVESHISKALQQISRYLNAYYKR